MLARYVKNKRRAMKITMNEWAALVGRSTRTMQGLERGENQGPETYSLTAEALGLDPEVLFAILSSGVLPPVAATPSTPAEQPAPAQQPSVTELLARIERLEQNAAKRPTSARGRSSGRPSPPSTPP